MALIFLTKIKGKIFSGELREQSDVWKEDIISDTISCSHKQGGKGKNESTDDGNLGLYYSPSAQWRDDWSWGLPEGDDVYSRMRSGKREGQPSYSKYSDVIVKNWIWGGMGRGMQRELRNWSL